MIIRDRRAPADRRPPNARDGLRSAGLPLLCCLLVVALLAAFSPADDEVRRAYRDVGVGQTAANRDFRATVTTVQLTRRLRPNDYQPLIRTPQMFIVVGIEAAAPAETVSYTGIELITADGHRYQPRSEFVASYLQFTQPGFRTSGVAVFELPGDRVPGARVILGPDRGSTEVYASMVRVDLGLTAETSRTEGPVELKPATTGVIR